MQKPLRVLDLGCAQGFFSFNIAAKGGNVTAVDLSEENITLGNILAEENANCKIKFIRARIEEFVSDIAEGEYDLVLMLSVLHNMSKYLGVRKVQSMATELSRKIPCLIVEFAIEGVHASYIPKNYRDFLPGYPFIRTIFYSDHRNGSNIKRPLCFAGTRYAYFEETGIMEIDRIGYNVHPYLNKTDVMHFHCGDKFIKFFNAKNQDLLIKAQQEIAFLKEMGGKNGLPKLYDLHVENDPTGIRIFIVRAKLKGIPLSEKISSGETFDSWDIIKQALRWMVFLEKNGYYHGDVQTSNFIYGDDGNLYPIDYEEIRREPIVLIWPYKVNLLFFIFMNEVLVPSRRKFAFHRDVRLLTEFKTHISPEKYKQILTLEDSNEYFARLYEILFKPENKSSSKYAPNTGDLEIWAIEKYLEDIGKKLKEYQDYFDQVNKMALVISKQQQKIQQLEDVIRKMIGH